MMFTYTDALIETCCQCTYLTKGAATDLKYFLNYREIISQHKRREILVLTALFNV